MVPGGTYVKHTRAEVMQSFPKYIQHLIEYILILSQNPNQTFDCVIFYHNTLTTGALLIAGGEGGEYQLLNATKIFILAGPLGIFV